MISRYQVLSEEIFIVDKNRSDITEKLKDVFYAYKKTGYRTSTGILGKLKSNGFFIVKYRQGEFEPRSDSCYNTYKIMGKISECEPGKTRVELHYVKDRVSSWSMFILLFLFVLLGTIPYFFCEFLLLNIFLSLFSIIMIVLLLKYGSENSVCAMPAFEILKRSCGWM